MPHSRPILGRRTGSPFRIGIVGSVGLPANYGGFETLVENLVDRSSGECDFRVICSSREYKSRRSSYKGAALRYLPLRANGITSVLYDILGMLRCLDCDSILVLGVSGAIFFPILRLFYGGKIVVNIDGFEWRRSKWNVLARNFLRLSEGLAVRTAHIVIADNKVIGDYVKKKYGKRPVSIEYGGDQILCHPGTSVPSEVITGRYAVSVCRIEPENNIDLILGSFARYNALPLVFIGNWEGSRYGRRLRQAYAGKSNLRLLDPIYDLDRLNSIRSGAAVYIHGNGAGGTNPSLVEAMTLGLPILAFDVSFNRETTENSCNYYKNEDELVDHLSRLDIGTAASIADRMVEIARRRYTWERIAKEYQEVLVGLPGNGQGKRKK